jgi:cyclophilin family peptidyl-prolyl cis-trans isomerase/HEAT repeat protein
MSTPVGRQRPLPNFMPQPTLGPESLVRRRRRPTRLPLVLIAFASCLVFGAKTPADGQTKRPAAARAKQTTARELIPSDVLTRVVRAEDERRWDETDLGRLLTDPRPSVRRRAALAAGRIGDEGAVAGLAAMLRADADEAARATAAFALGEIESEAGADALLEALRVSKTRAPRARAVEALGKIAAALGDRRAERRKQIGAAVLSTLEAERSRARPDRQTVLLGLTAVLRARPEGGPAAAATFLDSKDARVRADAANTLTRLRAKESLARLRVMLANDPDAVARANAARALGAAEDPAAFDLLLSRALKDADQRVRVSALRSVALLRDARAAGPLVKHGERLLAEYAAEKKSGGIAQPSAANELLEVAAALGRLLTNTNDQNALALLRQMRAAGVSAPEVESALARVAPAAYVRDAEVTGLAHRASVATGGGISWRQVSAVGQALGELAAPAGESGAAAGGRANASADVSADAASSSFRAEAQALLRSLLAAPRTPALAAPDLLRALAAYKPNDLAEVARARLDADDVMVRATAADLLGELPPDDANARALIAALPRALRDEMNDAALSTLTALGRQRGAEAERAVDSALEVSDHLVRRRASEIVRARADAGASGASTARRALAVNTQNREADYARALARVGKEIQARVETDKGAFVIEFLPGDAPLTVDNFVELARRGFFDGVTFHRVVPNFVVQGGDPRGDGNGGPGHQIRCEINAAPYERGAVGMALSGKDTGGSQWFVTHSPQPHLDGGYTVFGNVVAGMDVVDRLARGDRIRSVTVTERERRAASRGARRR